MGAVVPGAVVPGAVVPGAEAPVVVLPEVLPLVVEVAASMGAGGLSPSPPVELGPVVGGAAFSA